MVKAEISDRQMQQGYRDATLAMGNARLTLAVLLSATLDENFTVVDDLHAAPPLPPFTEVRSDGRTRQSGSARRRRVAQGRRRRT